MSGEEIPRDTNTQGHKLRSQVPGWLGLWVFGCLGAFAASATPEQIEFFESKIRPVLVEHCYSCHSEKAEKVKGGLKLDTRDALLKGGTSGPVITPGNPNASLLIQAVRYTDPDLQMPPKDKKLSAEKIATLDAWVKMGAPMPASEESRPLLTDVSAARAKHWAFQPVQKPALPTVQNSNWVQTPVDNFILAKLEEKQLTPSLPADRRTLIRRLNYDLIGLPPTPGEVEAFVQDNRPDAYALLVDRLLASPRYGERWGRHWLDVARYADTKGYLAEKEERRFEFSYTYRDYVIRSFNEDKPYDQFLIEQIAADCLLSTEDTSTLAAMGFLTLGRRFLNNQNDIIDDRIDVITRGTMGLTVTCARCHDHKFDPISTEDYYALHGIFDSSMEPEEMPLLKPYEESGQYQDYLKETARIEKEVAEFEETEIKRIRTNLRKNVGNYLLAAKPAALIEDQAKFDEFARVQKVQSVILRRWITDLDERAKKPDPIFGPWFELSKLGETNFTQSEKPLLARLVSNALKANTIVTRALVERKPGSLKEVAEVYTKLFQQVDSEWQTNLIIAASKMQMPPPGLADPEREALRQMLYGEQSPPNLPITEVRALHANLLREGAARLRKKITALTWTHPGVPPRAVALVDSPYPHNSPVLKRGNPGNRGEEVPRRFLEVLSMKHSAPFTNGSGRLELARAIASSANPLTARVYVNRVWLHHFGAGLVGTPGDFGVRTEVPLHHDLLDYLAASFVENGWSTKKLHRLIVMSSTYQQSGDANSSNLTVDPENHYLHHMKRSRLDFESLRDTLLAISGKLDLQVGGLPVDLVAEPFSSRRTVYGVIDRQDLPGVFRTFDFANPDASNQGRFQTTVSQQALFLMNSPFIIEQVRGLIQRREIIGKKSNKEKIQALHQLIWQRPAEDFEIRQAEEFMAQQSQANKSLSPLGKYAQVLIFSNELMFVD